MGKKTQRKKNPNKLRPIDGQTHLEIGQKQLDFQAWGRLLEKSDYEKTDWLIKAKKNGF